jgi:hypothetical protein
MRMRPEFYRIPRDGDLYGIYYASIHTNNQSADHTYIAKFPFIFFPRELKDLQKSTLFHTVSMSKSIKR